MSYRLNNLAKELQNLWYENYCKENDNLGGNSADGDFVDGWCIIDNDKYIKTIEDECGLLLFAYDSNVIDTLYEWAELQHCGYEDKCCGGFSIGEIQNELLKNYLEEI